MPNSRGWLRVCSGTFTWGRGSTSQCPVSPSLPLSRENVTLVQHFTACSSSAQNHRMSEPGHVHVTDGKAEPEILNNQPLKVTQGKFIVTGTLIYSSHQQKGWWVETGKTFIVVLLVKGKSLRHAETRARVPLHLCLAAKPSSFLNARCLQTLPPAHTCGILVCSTPSLLARLSGPPLLTHLVTDLLENTGEEFVHHQLPREVFVQGAVTRAQGLGEVRLSPYPHLFPACLPTYLLALRAWLGTELSLGDPPTRAHLFQMENQKSS